MDEWDVFYYDEENEQVCSLAKYHAENCSVEPLVEAHPDVIYFFANLDPYRDWDFNEYPPLVLDAGAPEPFSLKTNFDLLYISVDKEPNAFGESIQVTMPAPIPHCTVSRFCLAEKHANDCPKWEE